MTRMFNPPHPGEVLADVLTDLSVSDAAARLGVTRATLSRIVHGHAGVSAEMALRLGKLLNTAPEMWTGLQSAYDLWQAGKSAKRQIARIEPLQEQAAAA